jgi:hypothetical protein
MIFFLSRKGQLYVFFSQGQGADLRVSCQDKGPRPRLAEPWLRQWLRERSCSFIEATLPAVIATKILPYLES